jgi:hypothetical protein
MSNDEQQPQKVKYSHQEEYLKYVDASDADKAFMALAAFQMIEGLKMKVEQLEQDLENAKRQIRP